MNAKVAHAFDWNTDETGVHTHHSKVVKAKTDYKRVQKSMTKFDYETSDETQDQTSDESPLK
tara:strand:+ start:451 stop:636 length:186 start_codon:yes stop_codon:yes gene_type:complete